MGLNRRGGTGRQRAFLFSAVTGLVIASATLTACSGSSSSSSSSAAASSSAAVGAPAAGGHAAANGAAVPAAGAPDAGAAAGSASAATSNGVVSGPGQSAAGGRGQSASAARLAPVSESIIYTAQLTVRAKDVSAAVARATQVVQAAGGYVSSENATSDPDHPANAIATIGLKIPVAVYQQTLASLSGGSLGTQLSLQQQAQDVTQEVADVGSQVTSDEAAIAQLRELLKHAGSVGELLSVQSQINQEEAQLEAMQAQQRALDHETSYATVTVTVVGPKAIPPKPAARKPAPPPGLASGATGGWHAFKLTIDWLLAVIGAVAPFAAALAVLAALVLYIRRRLARRPSQGEAAPETTVSLGNKSGEVGDEVSR